MYQIDLMSRIPIYTQIVEQTEKLILGGILREGDRMPSVRALSVELSVNPNTIQRAYTDLCNRRILCSAVGRGCFVGPDAVRILREDASEGLEELKQIATQLKMAGYHKDDLYQVLEEVFTEGGGEK